MAQLKKREEKRNITIMRLQHEIASLRSEVENLNSYISSELDDTIIFEEEEEDVDINNNTTH